MGLRSFARLFFVVKRKLLYVQMCVRVCDDSLKIRGFEKFASVVLLPKNEHNHKFFVFRYSLFIFNWFTIFLVSSTGFSARRMVPLRAMPVTPVCRMAGMSSRVMPPMATMGR